MPTLLLVDDNAILNRLTSVLLTQTFPELQVIRAANCAHAHREASGAQVDIILADVKLPDGDGRTLAAELWGKHPGLRVLLMTAETSAIQLEGCLEGLTLAVLRKPFESEDLVSAVRRALDERGDAGGVTARHSASAAVDEKVVVTADVERLAEDIDALLDACWEAAPDAVRISELRSLDLRRLIRRAFEISARLQRGKGA